MGSEILIATFVSLTTGLIKKLAEKVGVELTKNIIIIIVFAISVGYTIATSKGILSQELITEVLKVLTMAVGVYELLYKRILVPALENLTGSKIGKK